MQTIILNLIGNFFTIYGLISFGIGAWKNRPELIEQGLLAMILGELING